MKIQIIKKGTVIRDSIISGNRTYHPFLNQVMPANQYYSIGENCIISKAIIDAQGSTISWQRPVAVLLTGETIK